MFYFHLTMPLPTITIGKFLLFRHRLFHTFNDSKNLHLILET